MPYFLIHIIAKIQMINNVFFSRFISVFFWQIDNLDGKEVYECECDEKWIWSPRNQTLTFLKSKPFAHLWKHMWHTIYRWCLGLIFSTCVTLTVCECVLVLVSLNFFCVYVDFCLCYHHAVRVCVVMCIFNLMVS